MSDTLPFPWDTFRRLQAITDSPVVTARTSARDEALKRYQQFFDLWKDADPDAPALIEAKREYQALLDRGA